MPNSTPDLDRGIPIRAISRGLTVIQTINRLGPISMMQISREASLPYPTASRIVQSLVHEGFLERELGSKRYRVTGLVQTLSTGYQAADRLVTASRRHLEKVTDEVGWPVSLATRVGTSMMVRTSTHGQSSLTFNNYYAGFTLPISGCASGKVYLAYCDEQEREAIIDGWKIADNETSRVGLTLVQDSGLLESVRDQGYAVNTRNAYSSDAGKTSAIAVPIIRRSGKIAGTVSLIYFATAMGAKEAAEKFHALLGQTAKDISDELAFIGGL
ncbi:MAG: IclR family transcriptional regulator C-terminal domain-containing protein [Pseudomonadota bacterium]